MKYKRRPYNHVVERKLEQLPVVDADPRAIRSVRRFAVRGADRATAQRRAHADERD